MGLFLGQADLVLVGADTILADGGVVNKAGTYLLALAAKASDAPFHVCCEGFKFSRKHTVRLEEMDPSELNAPKMPNLSVRNTYFDLTPADLISAWITEQGVFQFFPHQPRK